MRSYHGCGPRESFYLLNLKSVTNVVIEGALKAALAALNTDDISRSVFKPAHSLRTNRWIFMPFCEVFFLVFPNEQMLMLKFSSGVLF